MSSHELMSALSRLYPADRLLTDDVHLASYESDGLTAFAARPRAVVVPETAQEVIETIHICSRT
ncbi:MAG: FAD-binding oxidoreductase, partial [Opitutae bacterium]|nr:FAD-binding oxidoreductase [Opitutae bacterium]